VSAAPEWMLTAQPGLCPCGCIGRRQKANFVDRTIDGAASTLRSALFGSEAADAAGPLQRLDARAKLVALLVALLGIALVRNPVVLAAAYVITLGLAAASRVSIPFFVKRVWLFVPIFTGIVVLPATFSFVTPGHIVVPLGDWFGTPVGLTAQGLTSAALLVLRVATSVSLVALLTVTTAWTSVLASLRALRVPRMFVLVLGMAYRYVFHLLGSVAEMYTARKARTAGPVSDLGTQRAFVASSAGALFGKAHTLSEEVHQSMVSRGYTGDARTLAGARIRVRDVMTVVVAVLGVVVLLGVDRVL
jgi:cobalt/nickel transport system permease protein